MTDNAELVKRLRAPHYWISGSSEGHEGENDVPGLAADRIEALTARAEAAEERAMEENDKRWDHVAAIEALTARVNTQIPALKQVVAEREARIDALEKENARVPELERFLQAGYDQIQAQFLQIAELDHRIAALEEENARLNAIIADRSRKHPSRMALANRNSGKRLRAALNAKPKGGDAT